MTANTDINWAEVIEIDQQAVAGEGSKAARCMRWDGGGCPDRVTGRSCVACGGCCNWPAAPHLSPDEVEVIRQPGCVVAAAFDGPVAEWVVLAGSRWTFGEMVIQVREYGRAAVHGAEQALLIHECGGLHYWARSAGTGSVGVAEPFQVVRPAAEQGSLL